MILLIWYLLSYFGLKKSIFLCSVPCNVFHKNISTTFNTKQQGQRMNMTDATCTQNSQGYTPQRNTLPDFPELTPEEKEQLDKDFKSKKENEPTQLSQLNDIIPLPDNQDQKK